MKYDPKELREFEDDDLVKLSKKGNNQAFEVLLTRHCNRLRTAIINIYGKRYEQDAYDAVQNACVKAWLKIQTFKEESSFYSWIYTIAINEAKSIFRKSKADRYEPLDKTYDDSDTQIHEPVDPDEATNPFVAASNKQVRALVLKAMGKLSDKLRVVAQYCYIQEYKPHEVAKIFKLDETTVRTRLHNARKQLHKQLKNIRNELPS